MPMDVQGPKCLYTVIYRKRPTAAYSFSNFQSCDWYIVELDMLNLYTEPRRCWIAYLRVELSSCSLSWKGPSMGLGYKQRDPPPCWTEPYGERFISHAIVLRHVRDGRPIMYAWSKFRVLEALLQTQCFPCTTLSSRLAARLKTYSNQADLTKRWWARLVWYSPQVHLCLCAWEAQLRSPATALSILSFLRVLLGIFCPRHCCWNMVNSKPWCPSLTSFWLSTFFKRRT